MTDTLVADAAAMYRDGHSLATVADEFKVDTRTLGREFRKGPESPSGRGKDGPTDPKGPAHPTVEDTPE